MALVSLHVEASTTLYASPEVDIYWDSSAPLSHDTRAIYEYRAQELASVYRERVFKRVPSAFFSKRAPKLLIRFDDTIVTKGGYFSAADSKILAEKVPSKKTPNESPRRKISTFNENYFTIKVHSTLLMGRKEVERIIAHEYFHAVHWMIHPGEPAWLLEGTAQVFEALVFPDAPFNPGNLFAAFQNMETSLIGELDVSVISDAQYGHLMLFFHYLKSHCGGEMLFWRIVESDPGVFGIESIDRALRSTGAKKKQCSGFVEAFREFQIARALNLQSAITEESRRWQLVLSSQARARARKGLPTQEAWNALQPWTAVLVEGAGPSLPKYLGTGIWLKNSTIPSVVDAVKAPDETYTRVLLLKLPAAPSRK